MSTATLSLPKVIAACERCISAVDTARAERKERALTSIQNSRWAWVARRMGPISRDEARERLAGDPLGGDEHSTTRWEIKYLHADQRDCAERILAIASVSDAYTMEISDKDFTFIGQYYDAA